MLVILSIHNHILIFWMTSKVRRNIWTVSFIEFAQISAINNNFHSDTHSWVSYPCHRGRQFKFFSSHWRHLGSFGSWETELRLPLHIPTNYCCYLYNIHNVLTVAMDMVLLIGIFHTCFDIFFGLTNQKCCYLYKIYWHCWLLLRPYQWKLTIIMDSWVFIA